MIIRLISSGRSSNVAGVDSPVVMVSSSSKVVAVVCISFNVEVVVDSGRVMMVYLRTSKINLVERLSLVDIRPALSVADLFDKGKDNRDRKPRLLLCFDLASEEASCVGCMTVCRFERSENFLTNRFTQSYIVQHKLPKNLGSYLFIDIVSARRPPAGLLLLLHAFLYAVRAKYAGVCMVCVTKKGTILGKNFGMAQHQFREDGATRHLMYMGQEYISFAKLNQKLRVGSSNDRVLSELCSRHGLQARTKDKLITRC